jgi:hypothetical protein
MLRTPLREEVGLGLHEADSSAPLASPAMGVQVTLLLIIEKESGGKRRVGLAGESADEADRHPEPEERHARGRATLPAEPEDSILMVTSMSPSRTSD